MWAARVVSYLCIFSYSCNPSHTQLVTTKWRLEHCKNICSLSLCRLASESRRGKGTLLMQLCVSPRCVLAVVEMHTHTHTRTRSGRFLFAEYFRLAALYVAYFLLDFLVALARPVWGCVSECVRIFKRKYTWIVICQSPSPLSPRLVVLTVHFMCPLSAFSLTLLGIVRK